MKILVIGSKEISQSARKILIEAGHTVLIQAKEEINIVDNTTHVFIPLTSEELINNEE